MRFKAFTVTPAEFEQWAAHQATPAAYGAIAAPAPAGAAPTGAAPAAAPAVATTDTTKRVATTPAAAAPTQVAVDTGTAAATAAVQQAGFVSYPREKLPAWTVPKTPTPAGLTFNTALVGNADRGLKLLSTGQGGCVGCHMIAGNPVMMGVIGPNLTHLASRTTIAAGLYPNDAKHLALWIKNARMMKPGVIMPTLGKGQFDPVTKAVVPMGLTDEQIADIVAYLQALK